MGVVDLDGVVLGEGADIAPLEDVLAHDVLGGGGDEEILLLQTQVLALDVIVGGIEDLGDDLGHGALLQALDIFALGEEVHIQGVGAVGLPEAQGVDLPPAVAGHQHIPGHGDHGGVAGMLGIIVAVGVPVGRDLPAEADLHRVLITGNQPAVRRDAPVVGHLGLAAVLELLAENTQLVADGIARGLQAQGRHAVHIAGGQAAQAAVAEAGVRLFLEDVGGVEAQILQGAGQRLAHAQVIGVLHQAAAHQELHGHIVDFLLHMAGILGRQKTAHDLADHHGRGLEDLILGGLLAGRGKIGAELILNGAAHFVAGNFSDHRKKPPW